MNDKELLEKLGFVVTFHEDWASYPYEVCHSKYGFRQSYNVLDVKEVLDDVLFDARNEFLPCW